MWKDSKVLVTGAAGFIGSHLVERLLEQGARVRCLLRPSSRGYQGCLQYLDPVSRRSLEIVRGDLRNGEQVAQAVEGCERVFHLGAEVSVPYSFEQPQEVMTTNVMGTLNVLTAVRDHSVQRLVNTSSSEVYGTPVYIPIDEQHRLKAQSPYAASKIAAEKLAQSFYHSYDLPVVTLRPFNTYGPRQSTRAVIAAIINQALESDQLKLGNLNPRRDFVFVDDTVDAFIRAAATPGIEGETLNTGTGRAVSIGELAETVLALMDHDADLIQDERRVRRDKAEVTHLCASAERAKTAMQWSAQTSLEDGLKQTIEWFRDHPCSA